MLDIKETILIDAEYLKSLLKDIDEARETIDMEVYIYDDTRIDYLVTNALCRAALRGVKIRLLVDGIGTINWGNHITHKLENVGIETKVFHPLPWIMWHWRRAAHVPRVFISKIIYLLSKINSRNHRKTCILDKKIVYVGSANITQHLIDANDGWRETSIRLINVIIDELQYAFERAWNHLPLKQKLVHFLQSKEESIFRLNYSWRLKHRIYRDLIKKIAKSQSKILITNSYFVPRPHLLRVLLKASRRGVKVILLLPKKSDVLIASLASEMFYTSLLQHGITVYLYLPRILHAKLLIIDDWYSIGTSNLNHRSFRHDLEIDVTITSDHAKEILYKQFYNDIDQAYQLKLSDMKKQSFFKKFCGKIILFAKNLI